MLQKYRIFVDINSQPARAVLALFTMESTIIGKWEQVETSIFSGALHKKEFKEINPNAKVPAMQVLDHDKGTPIFNMFESHAIMKYVCAKRGLPDHWYPTNDSRDIDMVVQIDMYLDWHHHNIRQGAAFYIFNKYISGILSKTGTWTSEATVEEYW